MLKKWLFKLDRIIIWPLLVMTLLFLVTGFSMTHESYRLLPLDFAYKVHLLLHPFFIPLFLIHVVISVYFAVLRWRKEPVEMAFLVQLGRFSGWALMVIILLYLVSGYALSKGMFFQADAARIIHRSLDVVIIAFLLHAGIASYYAFRKWLRV